MTPIGFYRGGLYPYESVTGIVLNLALFHRVLPVNIVRMISSKPTVTKITLHYHAASMKGDFTEQVWLPQSAQCFPGAFMLSHAPPSLKFKFCLSCLRIGYHSVFFCMPQVNVCAIHREPLIVACAGCQSFKTINVTASPCRSCGFYLTPPSDQIFCRRNAQLKVQILRAVVALDRWYTNISQYCRSGSSLFLLIERMDSYDTNPIDATVIKALGWPLPLELCEEAVARRRARLIRWVTEEKLQAVLEWETACQRLEKIHFRAPCSQCESSIESFSGYWNGEELSCMVCLKLIVYFLVRIRCSSLSQLSIPAGHYKKFGFDYLGILQNVQPARFGFPAVLIRVYFLKLLYNLSIYLNLGYSVRLRLLPWEGLLYDLSRPGRREGEGVTILGVSPLNKAFYCDNISGEHSVLSFSRNDNFGWVVASPGYSGKRSIVLNL